MGRTVNRMVLDLDEAAAEIQRRWFVWTAAGIRVHPITRDGDDPEGPARTLHWQASRPNARAAVVLSADGWAETAVHRPGAAATVHATAQVDTVEEFGLLLERVVELISWSGPAPGHRPSAPARPAGAERGADWVLGYDGLPMSTET